MWASEPVSTATYPASGRYDQDVSHRARPCVPV